MQKKPSIGIIFKRFEEATQVPLVPGKYAYAVSMRWFQQFKKSADMRDQRFSAKIDNNNICFRNELRRNLTPGEDYLIVSEAAWDILSSCYGGGPVLKIPVLLDPSTGQGTPVPVQTSLTLYFQGQSMLFLVPNLITIGEFKEMACKEASQEKDKTRIRDFNRCVIHRVLDDNVLIRDLNFPGNRRELLLEVQNEDGTWKNVADLRIAQPVAPKRTLNPALPQVRDYGKGEPGRCGLRNIGNTCFMNSSLQCLAHTTPLVEFFMNKSFTEQINSTSVLGAHGEIARVFAKFVREIWTGESAVVVPYNLKQVIGHFAPQFAGFMQQDAHEFITVLLDGLHEDLNRVISKPYYPEGLSGDGTDNESLAAQTIERILSMNNSVIMDIFGGLSCNKVDCPDCHKSNVTFGSFLTVQVPLPNTTVKMLTVTFIPYDRMEPPTIVSFEFGPTSTPEDARLAICKEIRREANVVFMFKRFGGDYEVHDPVISLLGENFAFEIPDTDSTYCVLAFFGTVSNAFTLKMTEIATPMLMKIPDPSITQQDLQTLCEERTAVFWTPTDGDIPAHAASLESKLKQNQSLPFSPGQRVQVLLSGALQRSEQNKNIVSPSVIAYMNCDEMKTGTSFNWSIFLTVNGEEIESTATDQVQLVDCLREMSTPETLDENNKWFCPNCRNFVMAQTTFRIWTAPQILVLHLSRFLQVGGVRRKHDINVSFPDDLDFTEFIAGPTSTSAHYRLFAVVEHIGSISGGHYTAHCFHKDKQEWYLFNDSHTSKASLSEVHSPKAYILFYERL